MIKNQIQITKPGWTINPSSGHAVQFYNSDNELMSLLGEFIAVGLTKGENAVVIATPDHRQGLVEHLISKGINIKAAEARGRLSLLDASDTLSKFMVGDRPDRTLFYQTIAPVLANKAAGKQQIRAFGEMVALLWKTGNKTAVIELEELWNELSDMFDFSLLCAYPKLHFILDNDTKKTISLCHQAELPALAVG